MTLLAPPYEKTESGANWSAVKEAPLSIMPSKSWTMISSREWRRLYYLGSPVMCKTMGEFPTIPKIRLRFSVSKGTSFALVYYMSLLHTWHMVSMQGTLPHLWLRNCRVKVYFSHMRDKQCSCMYNSDETINSDIPNTCIEFWDRLDKYACSSLNGSYIEFWNIQNIAIELDKSHVLSYCTPGELRNVLPSVNWSFVWRISFNGQYWKSSI